MRRKGAEIIVALTQQEEAQDVLLAQECPGLIDVNFGWTRTLLSQ